MVRRRTEVDSIELAATAHSINRTIAAGAVARYRQEEGREGRATELAKGSSDEQGAHQSTDILRRTHDLMHTAMSHNRAETCKRESA